MRTATGSSGRSQFPDPEEWRRRFDAERRAPLAELASVRPQRAPTRSARSWTGAAAPESRRSPRWPPAASRSSCSARTPFGGESSWSARRPRRDSAAARSRSPPRRLADAAVRRRDRGGAGLGVRRGPRRLGRARAPARDGRALRARRHRRPAAVPAPGAGRGRRRAASCTRHGVRRTSRWPLAGTRRSGLAAPRWRPSTASCATARRGALHGMDPAIAEAELREVLHGPGRHPRAPEVGARRIRVLEEIGAIRMGRCRHTRHAARRILGGEGSGADGVLRRLPRTA